MQKITELEYSHKGKTHTITFGHPETEAEFQEMFDLRYRVYVERGYIDPEKFSDDRDEYDEEGKSTHFIAKINGVIVGANRLIAAHPLPTTEVFSFNYPSISKEMENAKTGEVSRIVTMSHSERLKNGLFIPKHMVMIFLLYTTLLEAERQGLSSGLSCPKEKLVKKLVRLKAPIVPIREYTEHYPEDGLLYPDFQQKDDPVRLVFFRTHAFKKYFDKLLNNKMLFRKKGDHVYVLKHVGILSFLQKIRLL